MATLKKNGQKPSQSSYTWLLTFLAALVVLTLIIRII